MRRMIGRIASTNYISEDNEPCALGLLEDMLESRRPPGASTDRELFAGSGATFSKLADDDPKYANRVAAKAKKLGYTPNPNDLYISQLAKCEGDPLAFVPATGGKGHIKRVCEQRGLGCEGAIAVRPAEVSAPKPQVRLAPKIVNEYVSKYIEHNPQLASKPVQEVREFVIEKHGSKKKEL